MKTPQFEIDYNPATHADLPADVLANNQALIASRQAARQKLSGARLGDFVKTAEGKYLRLTKDYKDRIQTTKPSIDGGGSFYLNSDGTCSYSGCLDYPTSKERLRPTDEARDGVFWFFSNNEARAHNGMHFRLPCRVFDLVEA